jgi:hypothetical protein
VGVMMVDGYERYKRENMEQKEGFEYYYSLGKERNLTKVADEFGKAHRTVAEWSRQFNWQERVRERDEEVGEKLKEKAIDTVVEEKAKYRKIIKLAVTEFVKEMQNGNIKPQNIMDLERLIKLDLTLMGEPAEVSETKNSHNITAEDREAVNNLAGSIKEIMEDIDIPELKEE